MPRSRSPRLTSMPILRSSVLAVILVTGFALVAPASAEPADTTTIVAVGDLACQSLTNGQGTATCQSGAVADLVRALDPDRFLPLGDLQYSNGKLDEFMRVWDVQFGDLKEITSPTPGNHEYGTAGAQGYFDYFGAAANPTLESPAPGYYSFDLGGWHLVSMNSDICGDDPGCGPGTPQYEWLAEDLAASDAACTIVYGHHPYYDWRPFQKWIVDDGVTQNGGYETAPFEPLWELMYDERVDVVLVGHNHLYQRWAPQDAHGNAVHNGITQFVVGTGGRQLYQFGRPPRPDNLLATQNRSFGALKMALGDETYDYEFVSAPGQPDYTDAGTDVPCV